MGRGQIFKQTLVAVSRYVCQIYHIYNICNYEDSDSDSNHSYAYILYCTSSNFHTLLWTDFGTHRAPIQIQKKPLKKVLISIFIITFLVIIVMFIVFFDFNGIRDAKKTTFQETALKSACMEKERAGTCLFFFFEIVIIVIICDHDCDCSLQMHDLQGSLSRGLLADARIRHLESGACLCVIADVYV